MRKKIVLSLMAIIAVLFSCKKENTTPIPVYPEASEYYPLAIGNEFIYDVDSFFYDKDFDEKDGVDTFDFQLKEVITDTFTDGAGRKAFRLERYKRFYNDTLSPDSVPWGHHEVWWVVQDEKSVHRVEENVEFISLKSPIKEDFSWDGNVKNFKQVWDFTYDSVAVAGYGFDKTLKVIQRNDVDKIEHEYYEEVYARNIGLIKRHYTDVSSQETTSPLPVVERVEKGVIYTQTLVSYTLK